MTEIRFLLDEDISPAVATAARALGVDAQSVSEHARNGFPDHEQLRFAAADQRIFVTRNRNDFIQLTVEFARTGADHAGVLIVSRSIPALSPEPLAHGLHRSAERSAGVTVPPYYLDFLSGAV